MKYFTSLLFFIQLLIGVFAMNVIDLSGAARQYGENDCEEGMFHCGSIGRPDLCCQSFIYVPEGSHTSRVTDTCFLYPNVTGGVLCCNDFHHHSCFPAPREPHDYHDGWLVAENGTLSTLNATNDTEIENPHGYLLGDVLDGPLCANGTNTTTCISPSSDSLLTPKSADSTSISRSTSTSTFTSTTLMHGSPFPPGFPDWDMITPTYSTTPTTFKPEPTPPPRWSGYPKLETVTKSDSYSFRNGLPWKQKDQMSYAMNVLLAFIALRVPGWMGVV